MMTHNQRRAQWSAERHGQALERLRILDDIDAVESTLRFAGSTSRGCCALDLVNESNRALAELRAQLQELDA